MLVLLYGLFISLFAIADNSKKIPSTITLASTNWCPYSCDQQDHKGIVFDYLQQILKQQGIALEVEHLPWSRAINQANKGERIHGLLTAVEQEAPKLSLSHTPIMPYQVCFFGAPEQQWRYQTAFSLEGLNQFLGVIQDYAYGEPVDSYINNHKTAGNIVLLSGDNGVLRLIQLLQLKRIDVFVEEKNVTLHALSSASSLQQIENLGCMNEIPFYIAINPKLPWAESFLVMINKQLGLSENKALLKQITQSYIK